MAQQRALLVAGSSTTWADLVAALEREGVEFEHVAPADVGAAVSACQGHGDRVAIVDLSGDPARGMAAVTAFRRQARHVPVVAVVRSPSLELVRRIRLTGVFYLALEPVSADELRTILHDAFEGLTHGRASATMLTTRPKILIIDDDPDFRASTTSLLEAQGYAVCTAADGREGIAKARSEAPDLIVLDIMMEHDWAGYEVNQTLKYGEGGAARHPPILMVSSVPVDPQTRFSMSAEVDLVTADGYLTKPLDIPRFLEKVRAFLGQTAEGDDARR